MTYLLLVFIIIDDQSGAGQPLRENRENFSYFAKIIAGIVH
jgi:hypothetical protein